MTGRDKLYYALGALLFLVAVFMDGDLSDPQQTVDGAITFLALMAGAALVIYIKGKDGTGPYAPAWGAQLT